MITSLGWYEKRLTLPPAPIFTMARLERMSPRPFGLVVDTTGLAPPAGHRVRYPGAAGPVYVRVTTAAVAPAGTAEPVTCRSNCSPAANAPPGLPPVPSRVSSSRVGATEWSRPSTVDPASTQ